MKPLVAIFTLLTLLGSQIVLADEEKKTAAAMAESADGSAQKESRTQKGSADKKAAEEEPDCD
ncbi:MAG: hypothetical protein U9N50_02225 [Pseudomonadota bacterium]|nr:hypothetical protein [Pseudomonadota bacterium]